MIKQELYKFFILLKNATITSAIKEYSIGYKKPDNTTHFVTLRMRSLLLATLLAEKQRAKTEQLISVIEI